MVADVFRARNLLLKLYIVRAFLHVNREKYKSNIWKIAYFMVHMFKNESNIEKIHIMCWPHSEHLDFNKSSYEVSGESRVVTIEVDPQHKVTKADVTW